VSVAVEALPSVASEVVEEASGRRRLRLPYFSLGILVLFVLMGLAGPLIAPHDPEAVDLAASLRRPVFSGGTWTHAFGTDELGRDILSRLLYGARVSLLVSLAVVVLSGIVGIGVAVLSGYLGGRWDTFLMRLTDAAMAFPILLLAIVVVGIYGPSVTVVVIILALAGWPQYARVLRSEVLTLRTSDYVAMSRVMGCSSRWVIRRHILPNIAATILVLATLQMGLAIIAEGSLSFLGIGVPPPAASWGGMMADGRQFLATSWWLCIIPGAALSLTVLAANVVGDWLRVQNDPARRR
jgi:peptide/nickel transport system permease protein